MTFLILHYILSFREQCDRLGPFEKIQTSGSNDKVLVKSSYAQFVAFRNCERDLQVPDCELILENKVIK